jgi:hypothetical protein
VYWYDLEWQAVETVLSDWRQKLRSLDWLPSAVLNSAALGVPTLPMYLTQPALPQMVAQIATASAAEAQQLQGTRDEMNIYLATKRLYLEYGWPDKFRREEFQQRAEEFRKEFRPIQQAFRKSRRRVNLAIRAEEFETTKVAAQTAYSHWLKTAAGTNGM